ncbi:MAG: hypothetical protein QOI63_394 [Thermoplasmata archaeon]|nr:hypothetical protein [Thermoplasmata archaeon]
MNLWALVGGPLATPSGERREGFFRWDSRDRQAALLVAVVAVAAGVALRSRFLASWDSVLFALALSRFDVAASRPQAPGDPLYVGLGRLFQLAFPDANDALVALSIVLTAAAAVLLFAFVRRFASGGTALGAALAYLASPVVLFNASIATSYPGDAVLALGMAMLAWSARHRPAPWQPWALGALFAVATGYRQSLGVFLAPLAVYGLLPDRDWKAFARRAGKAAAVAIPVAALWAVPLLRASGGLAAYLRWNAIQSQEAVLADPAWVGGWGAVADHAGRLGYYLHWDAFGWLLCLLVAGIAALLVGRPVAEPGARPWLLLAVWVLPAALFYALVFSGWDRGPLGYALVLLPALWAAAAFAVDAAFSAWRASSAHPRLSRWAPVGAALCLLLPVPGLAVAALDLHQREVAGHDAWMEAWSRLPATYPPTNTTILGSYSWAFAAWQFANYTVWGVKPVGPHGRADWDSLVQARGREVDQDWYRVRAGPPPGTRHPIPNGTQNVVLFDFQFAGENGGPRTLRPDVQVEERFLPSGWRILLFHPDPGRPAIEDYLVPTPNQPL